MTDNELILARAEKIQAETHRTINDMMSRNSRLTYEAAMSTCMYLKIAELEIKVSRLQASRFIDPRP